VRGQKTSQKNPIPPQHRHSTSQATITPTSPAQPQNDLIDFGQNAPTATTQGELEQTLRDTSTVHQENQGSLIDFGGIKAALPDGNVLRRKDTDEGSIDEFVDAQG